MCYSYKSFYQLLNTHSHNSSNPFSTQSGKLILKHFINGKSSSRLSLTQHTLVKITSFVGKFIFSFKSTHQSIPFNWSHHHPITIHLLNQPFISIITQSLNTIHSLTSMTQPLTSLNHTHSINALNHSDPNLIKSKFDGAVAEIKLRWSLL